MVQKTIIEPDTKSVSAIKGQITKADNLGQTLSIKDEGDLETAVELLGTIKSNAKLIKVEKAKFLDPVNAIRKATMDLFRPIEDKHKGAEAMIKSKMSVYEMEKQQRLEEEEQKLQERMKNEEMKPSEVVEAMNEIESTHTEPIRTKKGTASYRTVYKMIVVNEGEVPQQYRTIDEVKLRKDAIAQYKIDGSFIQGVEIVEEKDVSIRI